jgi:hypothetical protein
VASKKESKERQESSKGTSILRLYRKAETFSTTFFALTHKSSKNMVFDREIISHSSRIGKKISCSWCFSIEFSQEYWNYCNLGKKLYISSNAHLLPTLNCPCDTFFSFRRNLSKRFEIPWIFRRLKILLTSLNCFSCVFTTKCILFSRYLCNLINLNITVYVYVFRAISSSLQ